LTPFLSKKLVVRFQLLSLIALVFLFSCDKETSTEIPAPQEPRIVYTIGENTLFISDINEGFSQDGITLSDYSCDSIRYLTFDGENLWTLGVHCLDSGFELLPMLRKIDKISIDGNLSELNIPNDLIDTVPSGFTFGDGWLWYLTECDTYQQFYRVVRFDPVSLIKTEPFIIDSEWYPVDFNHVFAWAYDKEDQAFWLAVGRWYQRDFAGFYKYSAIDGTYLDEKISYTQEQLGGLLTDLAVSDNFLWILVKQDDGSLKIHKIDKQTETVTILEPPAQGDLGVALDWVVEQ